MENPVQDIIDKIIKHKLSIEEYLNYLNSNNILIKANSILSVVHHNIKDDEIIDKLIEIGYNIGNESHVMGGFSNPHFAIAGLYWLNTERSLKEYNNIMNKTNNNIRKIEIKELIEMKHAFDWFE